jgi:hypothetical protein
MNIGNNEKFLNDWGGALSVTRWFFLAVFFVPLLFSGGCGRFFEKKPTEIETRKILNELGRLKPIKSIDNELPEIYRQEPKVITNGSGTKVFYFAKNHPVKDLESLVKQQLGHKTSTLPATKQLIVQCGNSDDAQLTLDFLKEVDVPPIQINIDCIILERFADVTMDFETSILIENFLGEGVTFGESRGTFDDDGVLESLDPAFPGASLREETRSTFGLDFGYWINEGIPGHQVRVLVDMLESRGYLKILLNPSLETINGKKAKIEARNNVPIQKVVTGEENVKPYNITDYQWVTDSLEVTPNVYADGSIGLDTKVKIGSRSKPEGVVQQSIITERSVNIEENRIDPGNSLVIGGFRKSETRSVIRGVPFFKDLPIVGNIFSSKDYEEKATELVFILIPSISSGGTKYSETFEEINNKYKQPEVKPQLTDVLTDPFGGTIYTEHIEQQALESETQRIQAEMQAAAAREEALKAASEAEIARAEAEKARQQAELEKARAQKAQAEAVKARAEADKAKAEAQKAQAEAKKATAEKEAVEKAKKAAEEAAKKAAAEKAALEKARKAAQEAAKKTAEEKAALEKAKKAAEEAARQAAKQKAEAQAEAEKAKEEAQKAIDEAKKTKEEIENGDGD